LRLIYYTILFLGIALALLVIANHQARDHVTEIVFLDIGQGDAILIQRGTTQILVDGGPDAGVVAKLGKYMPFWDRAIEMVILSHAHSDHYAGLIDVFDRFQVKQFVWSGAEEEAEDFEVFLEMLAAENCSVQLASKDRDFRLGEIYLDVLFPLIPDQFLDQSEENLNNTSIVIKVSSPEKSVLLTGDAEIPVEEELLRYPVYVSAEILKAGHHGSKTSSSELFISAVDPVEVVFCAGEGNKFNHPSSQVVDRFQFLDISTITLFESGDVTRPL